MYNGKSLGYSYPAYEEETRAALLDLNFEIKKGEFVAILGHNGSGKSTLARCLNGLITPTEGVLLINDLDAKKPENGWELRRLTGLVFQNPDNQLVATVVEEDVAFGPENLGVPSEEIVLRVEAALKQTGMLDYRTAAPHNLSGGQKQRVAIAGVLAMNPNAIALDESTAMLDPVGRSEVMKVIKRLNKEFGVTVILITHFMEEAAVADRVLVMNDGKIIMDDAPLEIFSRADELFEIGLEIPIPIALARIMRSSGVEIPNLLEIDEFVDAFLKAIGK